MSPRTSATATRAAEKVSDHDIVQVPVRMTRKQRAELKRIADAEERNLQTVLLRALRSRYPSIDDE